MIEEIPFNTCQGFDAAQQSAELVGYITQLTLSVSTWLELTERASCTRAGVL